MQIDYRNDGLGNIMANIGNRILMDGKEYSTILNDCSKLSKFRRLFMNIVTERLQLRYFVEQDLNDVFEYCSQDGIGEMAGWPKHESIEQTAEIILEWIRERRRLAIVWCESGKVIGHISIDDDSEEGREDTRELGCALNRDYQRLGIMSEAIQGVLKYLFSQNISYVWACCIQENTASKGLIEKCGFVFQQEGTYYSSGLQKECCSYEYRLSKDEWEEQCETTDNELEQEIDAFDGVYQGTYDN